MFSATIRFKSLIQNRLAAGYRVHFARFCTTFGGHCLPVRGAQVLPDRFLSILRFPGVILRKGSVGQSAAMDVGFRHPSGAEAQISLALSARLKSCPVTKPADARFPVASLEPAEARFQ